MKIDRRITNGLAWAGVLVVIGVPTADLLSAQFLGDANPVARPIAIPTSQTPANVPVATPANVAITPPSAGDTAAASPVDAFLQSGRKLPSYITGGAEEPEPVAVAKPVPTASTPVPAPAIATNPAPVETLPANQVPVVTDPIQVAAIPPAKVAPVPMPLSMRPKSVPIAVMQQPAPVIVPPSVPSSQSEQFPFQVTAEDLDDWETGPLADFLAQRQQQAMGNNVRSQPGYDPNGFYLDQGPNIQRDRVVGRETSPFVFFTD